MYQVIGNLKSRTLRVLWMLEELGLPYSNVNSGPRSDDALAVNPSGKVPVLICDGGTLIDSTAILSFLADTHKSLTYPAGTFARAKQDSMTHFLLDEVDGTLWTAARHTFVLPEERRMPAVKDSLRWEFARSMDTLNRRLGDGKFLMGSEMTVPDIIATHCLSWATNANFPVEHPALVDYMNRMTARPAYQRMIARATS
ncbi:glutathione S-transferase family protein [Actibacterium sp. XHP0104]|uniref:glutathione S-transferase family protein n=1 Tax=Actibacterium sp. XHP0104 TaxID=2984335 RepID=UPI0021E6EDC8|nr:glutathione S-transferase family protein [Actibacterium sp. XHP0104]MCV2881970.1 glutathione S-transferase family protein [Actibacterium sp. XHP0104]